MVVAAQRGTEAPLTVNVSQAELAQMIGVSREAVSKQLSLWRELGVIRIGRTSVVILSPAYFEAIVAVA